MKEKDEEERLNKKLIISHMFYCSLVHYIYSICNEWCKWHTHRIKEYDAHNTLGKNGKIVSYNKC